MDNSSFQIGYSEVLEQIIVVIDLSPVLNETDILDDLDPVNFFSEALSSLLVDLPESSPTSLWNEEAEEVHEEDTALVALLPFNLVDVEIGSASGFLESLDHLTMSLSHLTLLNSEVIASA